MVTTVNDLRSAYTCSIPSCVGFPSRQYVRQDLRTDIPLVHIPGVFATTMSTVTSPSADGQTRPRRGRRSLVPPELRAQTRRLKKQNLERRRRACISDKMNALHALALDLIGLKVPSHQKPEKADILNICYRIFEEVSKLVSENPELRSRLQRIGSSWQAPSVSTSLSLDETTQSSATTTESICVVSDDDTASELRTTKSIPRNIIPFGHLSSGTHGANFRFPMAHQLTSTPVCTKTYYRTTAKGSFNQFDSGIQCSFGEKISVDVLTPVADHQMISSTSQTNLCRDAKKRALERIPLAPLDMSNRNSIPGQAPTKEPTQLSAFKLVHNRNKHALTDSLWRPYI
ncbi:hypothetical protein CRM22_009207 [Opisthorchis felineus]|uniref:BHLH domain-containing protein n=1 Tax=Opisthorchis felineus TaxID=147828 RepID=A0A4S2LFS6_OPIFE|nr:hypothetical protein CRM22_009207 [Opisthorchis felineus]